jgi:hypothetical protein
MRHFFWKTLKYLLITVGVLFCLTLATCVYLGHTYFSPEKFCGKEPGPEVVAPGGKNKAAIYEFDCGAMDPFITHISILSPGAEIPYEAGNVFRASKGSRSGAWKGPYAEIEWLAPDHLLVRYIGDAEVRLKETKIKGVTISYQSLPYAPDSPPVNTAN